MTLLQRFEIIVRSRTQAASAPKRLDILLMARISFRGHCITVCSPLATFHFLMHIKAFNPLREVRLDKKLTKMIELGDAVARIDTDHHPVIRLPVHVHMGKIVVSFSL
jgi:hypothetical protein